jgi:hypothetical protein
MKGRLFTAKAALKGGVTATVLFFVLSSNSRAAPIQLGTAGPNNYAVLALGGNASSTDSVQSTDFAFPAGVITGNVGIDGAQFSPFKPVTSNVSGSSLIKGKLFYSMAQAGFSGGVNSTMSGTAKASGGMVHNAPENLVLRKATQDALAASSFYASIAATNV